MLTNGVQETLQFDVYVLPRDIVQRYWCLVCTCLVTHLKGEQPSGKYEKYIVVG